jgi:hypothetical protein
MSVYVETGYFTRRNLSIQERNEIMYKIIRLEVHKGIMLGGFPCHQSMARPRIADGGTATSCGV